LPFESGDRISDGKALKPRAFTARAPAAAPSSEALSASNVPRMAPAAIQRSRGSPGTKALIASD
jgi:hypothetical protein